MAGSKCRPVKYQYTKLCDVEARTEVNVYAVVTYTKNATKTRGTDYMQMVSIVDPTYCDDKKLKCLLFKRMASQLPHCHVGNIIRFHRLKVNLHNGDLQAQSGPGTAWLIFSSKFDDGDIPIASSTTNYTVDNTDTEMLRELRQWVANNSDFSQTDTRATIESGIPGLYIDVVCQVLGKSVIPAESCVVLHISDGTKHQNSVRLMEWFDSMNTVKDLSIWPELTGYIYDAFLFDDHFEAANNIQLGDMIKLNNLHFVTCKTPMAAFTAGVEPIIELIIHHGTSYNRGVMTWPVTAPESLVVRQRLDSIRQLYRRTHQNDTEPSTSKTNASNNAEDSLGSSLKHHLDAVSVESMVIPESHVVVSNGLQPQGKSRDLQTQQESQQSQPELPVLDLASGALRSPPVPIFTSTQLSQPARCASAELFSSQPSVSRYYHTEVLKGFIKKYPPDETGLTKTNITTPTTRRYKRSSIREFINAKVGGRCVVRGYLHDYTPKRTRPLHDIIQLYCPSCPFISSVPHTKKSTSKSKTYLDIASHDHGVPIYNCPQCKTKRGANQQTDNRLRYMYFMHLILVDESGWVTTILWKDHADAFFGKAALSVMKSPSMIHDIHHSLEDMFVSETKSRDDCLLECGIRSFKTTTGLKFEIYKTKLVQETT